MDVLSVPLLLASSPPKPGERFAFPASATFATIIHCRKRAVVARPAYSTDHNNAFWGVDAMP